MKTVCLACVYVLFNRNGFNLCMVGLCDRNLIKLVFICKNLPCNNNNTNNDFSLSGPFFLGSYLLYPSSVSQSVISVSYLRAGELKPLFSNQNFLIMKFQIE